MDFLSTELGCVCFRCIMWVKYKYIYENMCKALCFVTALSIRNQGQEAILIQTDGIVRSFPVRVFTNSYNWPICLPVSWGWDLCKVLWGVAMCPNSFEMNNTSVRKHWRTLERMSRYSRWRTRALYSIHVRSFLNMVFLIATQSSYFFSKYIYIMFSAEICMWESPLNSGSWHSHYIYIYILLDSFSMLLDTEG